MLRIALRPASQQSVDQELEGQLAQLRLDPAQEVTLLQGVMRELAASVIGHPPQSSLQSRVTQPVSTTAARQFTPRIVQSHVDIPSMESQAIRGRVASGGTRQAPGVVSTGPAQRVTLEEARAKLDDLMRREGPDGFWVYVARAMVGDEPVRRSYERVFGAPKRLAAAKKALRDFEQNNRAQMGNLPDDKKREYQRLKEAVILAQNPQETRNTDAERQRAA